MSLKLIKNKIRILYFIRSVGKEAEAHKRHAPHSSLSSRVN